MYVVIDEGYSVTPYKILKNALESTCSTKEQIKEVKTELKESNEVRIYREDSEKIDWYYKIVKVKAQ